MTLVQDAIQDNEIQPILAVKNISKRFGNVQSLENVSMEVYKGDVVGLLKVN